MFQAPTDVSPLQVVSSDGVAARRAYTERHARSMPSIRRMMYGKHVKRPERDIFAPTDILFCHGNFLIEPNVEDYRFAIFSVSPGLIWLVCISYWSRDRPWKGE